MFYLDNENAQVASRNGWIVSPGKLPIRLGLCVENNEAVVVPDVRVDSGERLLLSIGLDASSSLPEASLTLRFREDKDPQKTKGSRLPDALVIEEIPVAPGEAPWMERTLSLETLKNRTGDFIIEYRAAADSPCLMLYEFVVARPEAFSLARARAYRKVRSETEVAHYKSLYENSANEKDTSQSSKKKNECSPGGEEKPGLGAFIKSCIERKVGKRIDFKAKFLEKLPAESHLKVLSLCSGVGKVEYEIMRDHEEEVDITFYDLNEHLLNELKKRFHRFHEKKVMCGDINTLELPSNAYDIIICTSALHHIVELEHVVAEIAGALKPDGEFWSIAEYVGRNGTRLFDDAYQVANSLFRSLPEEYRLNRLHYSEPRVDELLPNWDCSASTFEGIRSESVEPTIQRFMTEKEVYRENCFIWALTSPSYAGNYDLSRELDSNIIQAAASLDAHYQIRGILKPNNYHAICGKKP